MKDFLTGLWSHVKSHLFSSKGSVFKEHRRIDVLPEYLRGRQGFSHCPLNTLCAGTAKFCFLTGITWCYRRPRSTWPGLLHLLMLAMQARKRYWQPLNLSSFLKYNNRAVRPVRGKHQALLGWSGGVWLTWVIGTTCLFCQKGKGCSEAQTTESNELLGWGF